MRKSLLVVLFLGLAAFKAEAQTSYFNGPATMVYLQTSPKNWFGTRQEQEVMAALLRVASQIDSEKDNKRRDFAKNRVALALARLGREREALQLAKSADMRQQIMSLVAIRAVLSGREKEAIALLPKLDEFEKVKVQMLLGSAFYQWRNDTDNARKWFLEARKLFAKSSHLAVDSPIMELVIAYHVAKTGTTEEARAIFREFDGRWKSGTWQSLDAYMALTTLFSARLQCGLEDDALNMLKNDETLQRVAIEHFFHIGRKAKALELLQRLESQQAFQILDDMNRDAPRQNLNKATFEAMQIYWEQLSNEERRNMINAVGMTISVARYESVQEAYSFIARNFKGEAATVTKGMLKQTVMADAELMTTVEPKILQKWRDEELKKEEVEARLAQKEFPQTIVFSGSTPASWYRVYSAAVAAKNLPKARFALTKAEENSAHKDNEAPARDFLMNYLAWQRLGDRKRANSNLENFKREAAKTGDNSDSLYKLEAAIPLPEYIPALFQFCPPRDLNIVANFSGYGSYNETGRDVLPGWMLKISDVPTRAVAIASRANALWPLETVQIQLN